MENPSLIEVCVLTGRKLSKKQLLETLKEHFSDRVEYYDGCIEVRIEKVAKLKDKSYYKVKILLDDQIGTDLNGLFGADLNDEVVQMHGMTCFLRDGLTNYFDNADEWVIFQDDFCDDFCHASYREIEGIENSLRDVLNYIFVCVTGRLDNFFESSPVNTKADYEATTAKQYQQNELHYLSFSDYSATADGKTPDVKSLIAGLQDAQDFDEFKGKVFPALIREEKHRDFMASLKQVMDSLEKMRNCIAHNRLPSSTRLENYRKSRDDLRTIIDSFYSDERTE